MLYLLHLSNELKVAAGTVQFVITGKLTYSPLSLPSQVLAGISEMREK
jgi:hypothetical protein